MSTGFPGWPGPFGRPQVVGNYPPRIYWFRGIPYLEESGHPNDWHCTLPDGRTLKGDSGAAIERLLKIEFFSTRVLVFPDGLVSINGITTRKVTNEAIDSRLQEGYNMEQRDERPVPTWYPLDPALQPLYKAVLDKALRQYLDNWTGEIFA